MMKDRSHCEEWDGDADHDEEFNEKGHPGKGGVSLLDYLQRRYTDEVPRPVLTAGNNPVVIEF